MLTKYKNNHLITRAFVVPLAMAGSIVMCSQSHSMEPEQFAGKSPRTIAQMIEIEAAREPRRILAQDPNLAWNLKDNPEDLSDADFFDLYQSTYTTKDGKDENLIYIDKLHLDLDRGEGNICLFRGDNLITLTKNIFLGDIKAAPREIGHLSSILYYFLQFSKDINDKFCCVCSIETKETERRRGYARFALKQLVETTFLMSSVSFINALIREDNFASQGLFKSLGFMEYDGLLSLDGGITLIEPRRASGKGNHYLSRFDWEKRRLRAVVK